MKPVNLKSRVLGKTVFIAGSGKNAGKTTLLNHLLRLVRTETAPAFLSVGVDGEDTDLVFGTPKPSIEAEAGDLVVTTEKGLEGGGGLFEIREVFPFRTTLGRLVAARVLRGGRIELIGPETNDHLARVLDHLTKKEGAATILVDGAAGRVTQVAADPTPAHGPWAYIFVLRVAPENLNSALEKLKKLEIIDTIPAYEHESSQGDTFFVEGALTRSRADRIPEGIKMVVMEDFTKVFLDSGELCRLASTRKLFFRRRFDLIGAVPVLRDIDHRDFIAMAQRVIDPQKILLNPYLDDPEMAGAA